MANSIAFPFRFDGRGATATSVADAHVRDMIEQVLFTAPGERVNNPTFGCGLLQLPFEPSGDTLQQTTEFLLRGALAQFLGDVIDVQSIVVSREEATFSVTVSYVVRRTRNAQLATFERTV
jgi:phage baseplate assembly protein W